MILVFKEFIHIAISQQAGSIMTHKDCVLVLMRLLSLYLLMRKICFFFMEQGVIILFNFFVNRNFAFNDSCQDVVVDVVVLQWKGDF